MTEPTKTCTNCGETFPATAEFFLRQKAGKFGFRANCKDCGKKYKRKWCIENPDYYIEYRKVNHDKLNKKARERHATNPEIRREQGRQRRVRDPETARRKDREYRAADPEKWRTYDREYRKANSEKLNADRRDWNRANPDKVRRYQNKWNTANSQRICENNRRYQRENRPAIREYIRSRPEITRAAYAKRKARKLNLPDTLTATELYRALKYFNGCCAVCGRQLKDLFGDHTFAADHWIALSDPRPDNPGTVATNMIPLCHGVGGCNNRKHNSDPHEWLHQKYSARKARQIIARIEAYFEWVREQDNMQAS